MGRPTERGEARDVMASVRLTATEAQHLKRQYGSLPKALRALVDLAWGHTERCRIHTYDTEPTVKVENGVRTTIKKCSMCNYISVTSTPA